MEKIDMTYFEPFDIEHVRNKHQFPDEYQYLIERLGKANTKRRQMLQYHCQHHEKIVGRRTATAAEEFSGTGFEEDDYYTEAPSGMNVSTVIEGDFDFVNVQPINLDSRSEGGFSMTSYTSSTAEPGNLKVPAPPPGFEAGPFQCPYCFRIFVTENRASWK